MCTSTQGDQPFNITWYRDSKALRSGEQTDSTSSSSSHQRHHFDERTIEINAIQTFSSVLTIHNISSQHNGNYTCQISNPAGVVDYTVALSVSGKRKRGRSKNQFYVVFDNFHTSHDVNVHVHKCNLHQLKMLSQAGIYAHSYHCCTIAGKIYSSLSHISSHIAHHALGKVLSVSLKNKNFFSLCSAVKSCV